MLATKMPIVTTTMEITTALVCLDTMAMAQFAQVGFAIIYEALCKLGIFTAQEDNLIF